MEFDFSSPWGDAAANIRQLMLDREAKRRQEMLDTITQQREERLAASADAQTKVAQMQAKSLVDQRNQEIEDRRQAAVEKQQAADEKVAKTIVGAKRRGDKITPDEIGALQKVPGMMSYATPGEVKQGALLGNDEGGVPQYETSQDYTFGGSQEERKAEDVKSHFLTAVNSNPELRKDPRLDLAFQTAAITGDYAGAMKVLEEVMKPDSTPRSLALLANDAMKRGDTAEYQRLLKVIKETGQADDRPFAPFIYAPGGIPPEAINRNGPHATAAPVLGADGQPLAPTPTAEQANRAFSVERSKVVIDSVDELSAKINTAEGLMAKMTGAVEKQAAKANYDDDVAEYLAVVDSFSPLLARAMGHTGVLTQQDVDSAKAIIPKPGDSKTLRDRKMLRIRKIMTDQPTLGGHGGGGADNKPSLPPPQREGESSADYGKRLIEFYRTKAAAAATK